MPQHTQQATVLGPGVQIEGNLHLQHDAIISAEIAGNVHSTATIQLTATARVHGHVYADTVKIAGHVGGNLTAQNATELLAGARIEGHLETGRLIADDDATFEGSLRLRGSQATAAETPQSQANPSIEAESDHHTAGTLPFQAVPGTVNAALRSRRRVKLPSPA